MILSPASIPGTVPPLYFYQSGEYYDNSFTADNNNERAATTNFIDLSAWYTPMALTVDRIGLTVSSAVGGSEAKVVIYAAGSNYQPTNLLFESNTGLITTTTGYKFTAETFTFQPNTLYWVGLHTLGAARMRAMRSTNIRPLRLVNETATTSSTILRLSQAYASGAPSTFTGWSYGDNLNPWSIRMRAA